MTNALQNKKVQFAILFFFTLFFLLATLLIPEPSIVRSDPLIARIDTPEDLQHFPSEMVDITFFLNPTSTKFPNPATITDIIIIATQNNIEEQVYGVHGIARTSYGSTHVSYKSSFEGLIRIKLTVHLWFLDDSGKNVNRVYTDLVKVYVKS